MSFPGALLSPDAPVPGGLCAPEGGPVAARFNVYRNNVTVSLIDALKAGFPVVLAQVGATFFEAMAAEFIRIHPPKDPRLVTYGIDFPSFLEGFPPLEALPWLGDTARLELALRRAYHAADPAPFDPASLAHEAADKAIVHLAPGVCVLSSPYPIHAIWRAAVDTGAPPARGGAQTVLITRPEFDPTCDLIDAATARFLTGLRGAPLGTAASEDGLDLAAALTLLLSRNAIESLEFPHDPHDP